MNSSALSAPASESVVTPTPSSAQAASFSQRERAELTALPRRVLLALYWVVPMSIVLPLLDGLLLGGAMKRALPIHPDDVWMWTLIFNVPHLVASSLLLLDREYLRFYRRPLSWAMLALPVFWVTCVLTPHVTMVWITTVITTYHLLGQQVGILRMMGGGDPGRTLAPYHIMAVVTWLLASNLILPDDLKLKVGLHDPRWLSLLCFAALTALAWPMWRRVQGRFALTYLAANHLMFAAFIPLAATGYGFFFALMPRIVHDLSAFSFYVVHDMNRNRERPRSLLYKCFGFLGLPAWVLLPCVSVGIGYVITTVNPGSLLQPIGLISLFHYITEAVTWRRGGLHRQSIAVR